MLVLAISDLEHDSAVALLDDKGLVAAIEEDKLGRSPSMGGIPYLAFNVAASMLLCLRPLRAASD